MRIFVANELEQLIYRMRVDDNIIEAYMAYLIIYQYYIQEKHIPSYLLNLLNVNCSIRYYLTLITATDTLQL